MSDRRSKSSLHKSSRNSFNQQPKKRLNKQLMIRLGLFLLLPLLLLELWVPRSLFNHVSYTNSRNMDPQIEYFNARQDWDFVVFGSSETKWGIAPGEIEAALATEGLDSNGFNLGFDGFGPSYYLSILPFLQLPEQLPQMRVALIGLNIIEGASLLPPSLDEGFPCDGILQRAILNSAFAKDRRMEHLCNSSQWPAPLVNAAERMSSIIRYRQSLRTFLLGQDTDGDLINLASNGVRQYENGFYAHLAIQDNEEESAIDLQRFLDKEQEEPENYKPLASNIWPDMLVEEAVIDQWADYFSERDILPVFFALPTNPVMIDARNRRADYQRNSDLTSAWASSRQSPTVFIDLGIKDNYDVKRDFADYRHLSEAGAIRFSRELGAELAQVPLLADAFSGAVK